MKKILVACIVIVIGFGFVFQIIQKVTSDSREMDVSSSVDSSKSKTITYSGQSGKNALQLLQEKMSIKQDNSGLVISINNTQANPEKREYWSFYVNGKMAHVGPQDYGTEDGDNIEWRLENY
jgi:hypothetical protein